MIAGLREHSRDQASRREWPPRNTSRTPQWWHRFGSVVGRRVHRRTHSRCSGRPKVPQPRTLNGCRVYWPEALYRAFGGRWALPK